MTKRVMSSTKEKILDAALKELISKGFAGFTIQGVAAGATISLGNLTYHFRTREVLLEAMIDHWYAAWEREFLELAAAKFSGKPPNFARFIDWVMDGATRETNVRTFTELWAMSNHIPKLGPVLDNLYRKAVDTVLEGWGLSPADKRSNELRALLYVLAAASEGTTAVFGHSPKTYPHRRTTKTKVREMLVPLFTEVYARTKVVR